MDLFLSLLTTRVLAALSPPSPAPARERAGNRWRRRPPDQTLADVETTAAFRLSGNEKLTAAAVTRRLGIEPTRSFEAGDPLEY